MADELVLYEVSDGVATVTLNDPEKRNRLSGEMLTQLVAAIRRARDDEDARAVVLTGAGKAFCRLWSVCSSFGCPNGTTKGAPARLG